MNDLLMDIRNKMWNEFHVRANITYVLKDENGEIRAVAYDANAPFSLFKVYGNMYGSLFIESIPEWDFNIDSYLLEDMEDGFDIAYMPLTEHYNVWGSVKSMEDDIDHQDGLQKYLKYCQTHDITPEAIRSLGMISNLNIMNMYKEMNHGYRIVSEYTVNKIAYVIGHNPKAPEPFAVWRTTHNRSGGYDIGHYFETYDEAFNDFKQRISDEVDKQVYLKRKCFKKEERSDEVR